MNTHAILTPRQLQVTELIAWGATKKDVANLLHISCRTVETTVKNIFFATEVTKVNELSAWWFCTHFNISFDFSPLKRSIASILLLVIFLPFDFSHSEVYRSFRSCRSGAARVSTSRRNETEL